MHISIPISIRLTLQNTYLYNTLKFENFVVNEQRVWNNRIQTIDWIKWNRSHGTKDFDLSFPYIYFQQINHKNRKFFQKKNNSFFVKYEIEWIDLKFMWNECISICTDSSYSMNVNIEHIFNWAHNWLRNTMNCIEFTEQNSNVRTRRIQQQQKSEASKNCVFQLRHRRIYFNRTKSFVFFIFNTGNKWKQHNCEMVQLSYDLCGAWKCFVANCEIFIHRIFVKKQMCFFFSLV